MQYHVAKNGSDQGTGASNDPFLTINKAASLAVAGDVVIVHEGEYREWVDPKYSGLSNHRRIIYEAAQDEKVVIKGSEHIQCWEPQGDGIWKAVLPNSFIGSFNPYSEGICGDWLVTEERKHLGDVYLNGMSFYEVSEYAQLINPSVRTEVLDHWTKKIGPIKNPVQTKYVWYTEVSTDFTTIFANFHDKNPNEEFVEINVRRSCFYPTQTGRNYITVKGFEMAHAATPWTPPTADQPGLLGPNWAYGWIIEDNIIHDAKCSAISIGKEASTGNNYSTIRRDKPGYQYQLESVFVAERNGWCKETIGSHIIRNNTIYDCGQNAIVGHLGCIFSEVHHNHIYNIAIKREFYGYEIAGIKFHAAIDVCIHHNRIHDCSLGIWLDWQAQGTRVSKNLLYHNNRDFFVEVSHGPYIVDQNILASEHSIDNASQGGAYLNNLICGETSHWKVLNRSTPYHLPHSTKLAGFALIYGGDDRFINNIFIGAVHLPRVGTDHYKDYTTSLEEYIEKVHSNPGDVEEFEKYNQPVFIQDNAYFNGAEPFEREENKLCDKRFDPKISVIEEGKHVYLSCEMPENYEAYRGITPSTLTLGRVRIVGAEFECSNGTEFILNTDYHDLSREEMCPLGPFTQLQKGMNHIKVW